MIYNDNEELSREFSKFLIDQRMSKAELARRLGMLPQTFQQILQKKNLSFADMSRILGAMDYKLEYDFVPDEPPDKKKSKKKE